MLEIELNWMISRICQDALFVQPFLVLREERIVSQTLPTARAGNLQVVLLLLGNSEQQQRVEGVDKR